MKKAIAIAIALLLATAVRADAPAPDGAALLAPFKRDLKAALVEGMQSGPANAIDVCRLEAPALAAEHSKDAVKIGRSSHRLRNPANSGPAWVREAVASYLEDPANRAPRTVSLGPEREGYVEPILTQPLCLACHGGSLDPAVSDALAAHYPDDRATGFEAGDLRGVFWVEYPVAATAADQTP